MVHTAPALSMGSALCRVKSRPYDVSRASLNVGDAPGRNGTPPVPTALDELGRRATIIMPGRQVPAYPSVRTRLVERGQNLAAHSRRSANQRSHRCSPLCEVLSGGDVVAARTQSLLPVLRTGRRQDWRFPDGRRLPAPGPALRRLAAHSAVP